MLLMFLVACLLLHQDGTGAYSHNGNSLYKKIAGSQHKQALNKTKSSIVKKKTKIDDIGCFCNVVLHSYHPRNIACFQLTYIGDFPPVCKYSTWSRSTFS